MGDNDTQKRLSTSTQITTATGVVLTVTAPLEIISQLETLLPEVERIGRAKAQPAESDRDGPPLISRFNLKRHQFKRDQWGYVEALEILDPPRGRSSFVIHQRLIDGNRVFSEWRKSENALWASSKTTWPITGSTESFERFPGFKKLVNCGRLTPWFLAIDTEELFGDFAAPQGLANDPTYRLGVKCIVYDEKEEPTLKTCLGCRIEKGQSGQFPFEPYEYRVIYFDDGTTWLSNSKIKAPRILQGDEIWTAEALGQVKAAMVGGRTQAPVDFLDGTSLKVSRVAISRPSLSEKGTYHLTALVAGEGKRHWREDFTPTAECPTILSAVTRKFSDQNQNILWLKIREKPNGKGGEIFHAGKRFI